MGNKKINIKKIEKNIFSKEESIILINQKKNKETKTEKNKNRGINQNLNKSREIQKIVHLMKLLINLKSYLIKKSN
jgi:hypothetical protein